MTYRECYKFISDSIASSLLDDDQLQSMLFSDCDLLSTACSDALLDSGMHYHLFCNLAAPTPESRPNSLDAASPLM
jgi:hypothetical protein